LYFLIRGDWNLDALDLRRLAKSTRVARSGPPRAYALNQRAGLLHVLVCASKRVTIDNALRKGEDLVLFG